MDFCAECGEIKGKNKILYESALCKQLRCENHLIWVPSHVVDHSHLDTAKEIKRIIENTSINGWYCFCGRSGHIPRGMSYWFGENRMNGKIIERVGDHQKLEGYEFYQFWEIGIVEDGIEKRWEKSHFEPSCEFSLSLRLAHRFALEFPQNDLAKRIYDKVVSLITIKKRTFFSVSENDFVTKLKRNTILEGFARFLCSRCIVVACLNRLTPFFDKKAMKRHIANPEELQHLKT